MRTVSAADEPVKNFPGILTFKAKRRIAITTVRCTKCGYLESYGLELFARAA
jgi:hypothetical protein